MIKNTLKSLLAVSCIIFLFVGISSCDKEDKVSNEPFGLSSASFENGGVIPIKYSCKGANISPQLKWENAPEGTHSFVVIVDDECPPCGSGANACRHWSVYNIPSSVTSFNEGEDVKSLNADIHVGSNYQGSQMYAGPCPPNTHTYTFTVYAMDSGFEKYTMGGSTRATHEQVYGDNILASASITGDFTP